ncbi:MAG: hypothetical protein A4S08_05775 [Proteobacteria bacterium SG_bin4]|nr:MAG: hypothetical protein A4S08_05775 [Proteobacteria bacterium SG_bin4]
MRGARSLRYGGEIAIETVSRIIIVYNQQFAIVIVLHDSYNAECLHETSLTLAHLNNPQALAVIQ